MPSVNFRPRILYHYHSPISSGGGGPMGRPGRVYVTKASLRLSRIFTLLPHEANRVGRLKGDLETFFDHFSARFTGDIRSYQFAERVFEDFRSSVQGFRNSAGAGFTSEAQRLFGLGIAKVRDEGLLAAEFANPLINLIELTPLV